MGPPNSPQRSVTPKLEIENTLTPQTPDRTEQANTTPTLAEYDGNEVYRVHIRGKQEQYVGYYFKRPSSEDDSADQETGQDNTPATEGRESNNDQTQYIGYGFREPVAEDVSKNQVLDFDNGAAMEKPDSRDDQDSLGHASQPDSDDSANASASSAGTSTSKGVTTVSITSGSVEHHQKETNVGLHGSNGQEQKGSESCNDGEETH